MENKLFNLLDGQELFHLIDLVGFWKRGKDKDPEMNLSSLLFLISFLVFQYYYMHPFQDYKLNLFHYFCCYPYNYHFARINLTCCLYFITIIN